MTLGYIYDSYSVICVTRFNIKKKSDIPHDVELEGLFGKVKGFKQMEQQFCVMLSFQVFLESLSVFSVTMAPSSLHTNLKKYCRNSTLRTVL